MPFKDYAEVIEPLVLPIFGVEYTIPPLTIASGIKVAEVTDPKSPVTMSDEEFFTLMLGAPLLKKMRAAAVPPAAITLAAQTALAFHQRGRAVAELLWESDADPKAAVEKVAPNRAARRTVASSTPRPASGSTRRKTPPKK